MMNDSPGTGQADRARAGLCARCRHAQLIRSAKGTTFWRCGRSDADPAYPRYPRLPVVTCAGFEPAGAHTGK